MTAPTAQTFQEAERQQVSMLASAEKKVLVWMAERMPAWVNSDHLTVLGFLSMIAAGLCYWAASWDRRALIGAIVALAVNWFGDSLDGTLARVRNRPRPIPHTRQSAVQAVAEPVHRQRHNRADQGSSIPASCPIAEARGNHGQK